MIYAIGGGLPRAVRLIAVNALIGAGVGAVVAVAVLLPAGPGLGHLILTSEAPWIPALLFFSGMMGTFAGLAAGTAIMLTVRRRGGPGEWGRRPKLLELRHHP